jgi:hypothetical protein
VAAAPSSSSPPTATADPEKYSTGKAVARSILPVDRVVV